MRFDKALEMVTHAEEQLAEDLTMLAGRHATEHDVYHLGHAMAERSREHLRRLTPYADQFGAGTPDGHAGDAEGPANTLRRVTATVLGRSEISGQVLLRDLKARYLTAQDAEIGWVILLQAAKAARHSELVQLSTECREEAEGTSKWLRTRIKETAPQVLATG